MRAVNLLPKDAQPRSFEKNRGVAFGGVGGFALVSVVLSATMLMSAGKIKEQQATLDGLNAELAALPAPVAPTPTAGNAVETEKQARLTALSDALGGRLAWDRILRRISLVLPNDVWLTSLTAQGPSAQAAAAGPPGSPSAVRTELLLNGSTYSQDAVARLLSRLSVVPDLTNVQLQNANRASARNKPIVQFAIRAEIKTAGAAS